MVYIMPREAHKETWGKVNALVDTEIAGLVSALNEVAGLETSESCQGEPVVNPQNMEAPGYVYFYYNDWQTISRFAFDVIAPACIGVEGTSISVEIFNESNPRGKLSVRTSSIPKLTASLTEAISRHTVKAFQEIS